MRGLCFSSASARLLCDLSCALYRSLLCQDVAFFDAAASGDLLSRLTEDAQAAVAPCSYIMSALARSLLQAIGGAVLCAHISWRLTLLAGSALGPVYALTAQYARFSAIKQKSRAEALGAASAVAGDALGAARVVRAFSAEGAEARKYKVLQVKARDLGVADAVFYAATVALTEWVTLATSLVLLAVGGGMVRSDTFFFRSFLFFIFSSNALLDRSHLSQVSRGQLTVGELVAFTAYFNRIDASWNAALSFLQSLTSAAGSAERVLSVVELVPAIGAGLLPDDDDAAGGATAAPQPRGATASELFPPGPVAVDLRNVFFSYILRPDAPVLKGLSLSVPAGSTCALVGRSGGGKRCGIAFIPFCLFSLN